DFGGVKHPALGVPPRRSYGRDGRLCEHRRQIHKPAYVVAPSSHRHQRGGSGGARRGNKRSALWRRIAGIARGTVQNSLWDNLVPAACGPVCAVGGRVGDAPNRRRRRARGSLCRRRGICRRLSRLAGCSLLVVIVTGSYGAWRHVPGLAALGDTIYGRALSVKLFFVLTMVLLGAINRYLVLPKLPASGGASATGGGQSGADLLRQFFRRVGQEAFLMILVLGCVTFLIHSPSPGPFMDMTRHHPAHIRDAEGP